MHTMECFIALKIHYCLSARVQCNRANGSLRKENAPPLFIFPEKVSHSNMIMSPFALVFTGSWHGSIEKPWVSNPAAVPARWRQRHQREAQKGRRRTQLLFSIFLSSFSKALLRNCHLVAEVYTEWQTMVNPLTESIWHKLCFKAYTCGCFSLRIWKIEK